MFHRTTHKQIPETFFGLTTVANGIYTFQRYIDNIDIGISTIESNEISFFSDGSFRTSSFHEVN